MKYIGAWKSNPICPVIKNSSSFCTAVLARLSPGKDEKSKYSEITLIKAVSDS